MHWIVDATHLMDYRLQLTFENGVQKIVDLKSYLSGEIFQPLRDIEYFKTMRVNPDTETIEWPNGADMSPDFLYEIGEEVSVVEEALAG